MPPKVFQVCDRVYCVMRKSYYTSSYLVTMEGGRDAQGQCDTLREHVAAGGHWPLFG